MNAERAIVLPDWPQPEAGAPMPKVFADDLALFIWYTTKSDQIAVVHFSLCSVFTFGAPNDEALNGHPLYGKGLDFYAVHRVENSSWIALLERRNAVHPSHNREAFLENLHHYVFTFHDSTLECVVTEGPYFKTETRLFENGAAAEEFVRQKRRS